MGGWVLEELELKQALKFSFGLGLCNILQANDNKEENLEKKKEPERKKKDMVKRKVKGKKKGQMMSSSSL